MYLVGLLSSPLQNGHDMTKESIISLNSKKVKINLKINENTGPKR